MLLGGHVSIAGGFALAPERADAIGANCLQMFSGSPRGWNLPRVTEADAAAYKEAAKKHGIEAAYFHASYLVNLADDGFIGDRSVDTLIAELKVASALGVRGSIIHLGSFKDAAHEEKQSSKLEALRKKKNPSPPDTAVLPFTKGESQTIERDSLPAYEKHPKYDLLIRNIKTVLKNAPKDALFIIEGMGTRKIGRQIQEIGNIVRDIQDQRVRVCLDTCHMHVAGYDLSTKKKLDEFFALFDKEIGLSSLECIHMNDSRDEFGSLRDRHDNIGQGKVAKDVFKLLLNHPKTKHLAFLLEVPGFDDAGPDKKNIDILKSFIA